jgi:uncharacterized membrane protein YsdA (DUF1294 family)
MQVSNHLIFFYLIAINLLTFFVYKYDKTNAQQNGPSKELVHYRVSEKTLHLLSLIGGWPAALIAQNYLRHKTIKQPFQNIFVSTILINILMCLLFFFVKL